MTGALFVSGLVCGLFLGAILWETLVAGPAYYKAHERAWRLNERVRAWQRMYLYAEGARVATSRAIVEIHADTSAFDRSLKTAEDNWSRKVPDLKAVK